MVGKSWSNELCAHAGMLSVAVTFSLWNVLGDVVLKQGSDPVIIACYREGGTALVLSVACAAQHFLSGRWPTKPTSREIMLLLLCGVCGVFCLQLFFVLGLGCTNANDAAMFQPLIPVLVFVAALVLGLETLQLCSGHPVEVRMSWLRFLGLYE